jgi:hypothetical protein
VASLLAVTVAVLPGVARAETPVDRAACAERLKVTEEILESDGHYAYAWKDTWVWTGTGLVALGLTAAFRYDDYRRAESLVRAAQSVLLMLPEPSALTIPETLAGIRAASSSDPCLALADARYVLELEAADAKEQQGPLSHGINIAINVLSGLFVALAVHHWDFAGHGSEGVQTLVGIGLGELQILTYPSGSLKAAGSSLQVSF